MKDQSRQLHQEQMFQLIEEFNNSGKTRKDFCVDNKLAVNVFYYWQRKLREHSQGLTQGSFIAVKTSGRTCKVQSKDSLITLHYPNGVLMQVPVNAPVSMLRTLITLI